jgi:hypothetical protein
MAFAFVETLPGAIGTLQYAPGSAPGPGGSGGAASPSPGSGWEIRVLSAADYSTVLALLPPKMIVSFQFVKQLNDLGSGTVQLNMDDPWWRTATLADGTAPFGLLDFECLWQILNDGVPRMEFLGETITEQLVDASEQRIVSVTGPGAVAALKWAMAAPLGFPDIVLKTDAISDSFSEVDITGTPVLDTNIWTVISPAGSAVPTPVAPLFSQPGGSKGPNQLFPSGTLSIAATSGTSVLGATPYDATDTLISAQITPIGAANIPTDSNGNAGAYGANLNGTELTQFYVQSQANTAYYAMIGLSATSFYCQEAGPDGTRTHVIASASAFDPGNDQNWMITEQAGSGGGPGTFFFWTSPDGQNWTLQWQTVHTWNATRCGFFVAATYTGSGQSVILSNLNGNVTTPSYQGNIFLGTPAMGIWYDLLQTAQARGTIPFVTTSLSGSADSFGRPWTDVQNVQVTNGTDLFSLLQSFCATVNADFVMQPGLVLQVGQTSQSVVSLGADRTSSIVFREGRDQASKQRTRARNQILNLMGAENSDGHEISAADTTSAGTWGQREGWFQTSAQVDPASMTIAAAAAAADQADEQLSWTLTIPPGLTGKTVFSNFDVGDWVGLERPDFSAIDSVRVVGIAVSVDSTGLETNELTISSYLQWLEQQLTYISNKLGGAFVNALGTTPVAPSSFGTGQVPTYFTPAQSLGTLANVVGTAGAHAAPLVYNAATGMWQPAGTASPSGGQQVGLSVPSGAGTVVVNNGQVTATTSPTPIAAPDGGGAAPPAATHTISPTVATITDATGTTRTIVGQQADGGYTSADFGGPAHATPDTPTATGTLNGILVAWDGKVGGAAPPSDFLWTEVHLSTSSGFTPSAATLQGTLASAAVFPVSGLTVGTTYYVKLVERNTSGVATAASSQASAVPTSLTATLLGPAMGVLNANPYFTGGDGTGWAGASGTFSVSSTPPAGSPYVSAGLFSVTTGGVGAAAKESGAPFGAVPGVQYLLTAWVYTPQTTVVLGFDWQNSSHTLLSAGTSAVTVPANTWTLVTVVLTSPASTAWAVPRIAPTDGAGNSVYFQAILALPQVPGSLIQAGTITATQIAANTITAAQIAAHTITATQILAGTITATEIAGTTITAAKIAANTITASQIASGTITAGLLAAGIVKAGIVDSTTITGATIVADGSSGQVLVYSGTPASGNLIGSWSGLGGADASSNAYPAGLGIESGGLVLYDQASAPATVTGASTIYTSSSGRLRYKSQSGNDLVLDRSVLDTTNFSMGTQTAAQIMSSTINYLANEAQAGSEFEIEIDGTITTPSSTTTSLPTYNFSFFIDGAGTGINNVTFGTVILSSNLTLAFCVRARLTVNTTGAGGTCDVIFDGGAVIQFNGASQFNLGNSSPVHTGGGGGQGSTPLNQITVNKAFDTTANHSLAIYGNWGTSSGTSLSQSAITYRTKKTRRN